MGYHDIIQVITRKHLMFLVVKKTASICSVYLFVLLNLLLVCSNDDFEVIDQIFLITPSPDLESFLERDYDYKLHIHTRDFELGRTIDSNIEEAITHSRRLIVLLSR